MLSRPHTWLLLFSSMIAVAAGCSGGGGGVAGSGGEAVGQTSAAVVVCAGGSTVEGIDVSEFQGTIDWNAVKGSGRGFAIARVSDGTGHLDPYFSSNWSGIKAAGMIRGVYQFFRASEDPVAQANLLISNVGALAANDLAPVADVEVSDGVSGSTLVNNLASWVSTIKAATGRTPMIYSAPGFWDGLPNTGQFGSDVLWVANWQVSCPDTPTPWTGWTFWQYADNGNVPGISGAVDLDQFNGTAAQLGQAGGGADWGAQYVSQSFPLAAMALAMTEGQTIPSYIELRNIGGKPWDGNTHLATTQPRDRASMFADSSWLGPNRPAAVSGSVPPGGTFKFPFNLHAPSKPGTYFEYFGVVEEGVAWFSDPGQAGPPDNQLEVQVVVTAAQYAGDFSAQSFPLAPAPLTVHTGDVADGWIELTNTGTQTWKAGITKLAPIPRDKPSPYADASWLSPTRVSTVAADVPPGQKGRFPVKLDAKQMGDFQVAFGLVEEAVTWFADAPMGGGPADSLLKVHLVVVPKGAPLDAGVVLEGGPGNPGEDAGGNPAAPNPTQGGGSSSSGCGCRLATGESGSLAPLSLLVLALVRRRKRR
jgi:lysozyme